MKLFLTSEIDEAAFVKIATGLLNPTGIPELYVASPGGDLELAFGLHDLIRSSDKLVRTYAIGRCQSAAPLLVACGTGRRVGYRNTIWMLHSISLEEADGPAPEVAVNVEWAHRMAETYARLLARYTTKRDHRFWLRRLSGRDVFFTSEQALEWGLIDEIWESPE